MRSAAFTTFFHKEKRTMFTFSRTILFMLALTGLALLVTGCGRTFVAEAGEAPVEEHAEHAEEHAEPADEQEPPVGTLTVEQVMQARCEHGPAIECDECRYEVGVVKLDPSLLNGPDGGSAALVTTMQVPEKTPMNTAVNITGEVRLNENTMVHVSPRIAGVIHEVNVDVGQEVEKGQVLFTLDSVELGQALSDYEKNVALAALSEKNYRREKSLFDQKISAEIDMIQAQIQFEEHQTAQKAAEQRLHVFGLTDSDIAAVARGSDDRMRGSLAVRAPIDGTVIEKHAVMGELAGPEQATMTIADLSTVWVWGAVYERDLNAVLKSKTGESIPVDVVVPAFAGETFEGRMNYIGATMDEATRTVQVRTVVDNSDRRLRPGMFCEEKILAAGREEAMAVPKEAVISDEGVDFVFVHMKDDYFLRQNVKKGREFENGVEILEGVKPGQTIVANGAFVLKSDVLRSKMGAGCAD